jgi:predicted small metal-binding protein
MRVIECNECGETVSAADDDELAARMRRHLSEEHDIYAGPGETEALVSQQAYDAMDS